MGKGRGGRVPSVGISVFDFAPGRVHEDAAAAHAPAIAPCAAAAPASFCLALCALWYLLYRAGWRWGGRLFGGCGGVGDARSVMSCRGYVAQAAERLPAVPAPVVGVEAARWAFEGPR